MSVRAPERAPLAPRAAIGWLVALAAAAMCFISMLALGAGLSAARIAGAWEGALGAEAVAILPAGGDPEAAAAAALLALSATPGVAGARRAKAAELERAAAPWLGSGLDYAELGAPPLLVVTPGADFDPDRAQAALAAVVPGASLDDLSAWRAPLSRAARMIRGLIWAAAALAGLTLGALVAAAARSALNAARPAARALRLLGAEDSAIARAFERDIAGRAALGGALGAGVAAAALWALPKIATAFGAPDAATPLWPALAMPFVAAAIALAAARLSLMAALREPEG